VGELSKKIGEHGEKVVKNFLAMIGWNEIQDGVTIPCDQTAKHEAKTHGLDVFHSARSQLQDFTLDNVIVSVKYSSKPYPKSPVSTFKKHLKDLAHTLECFISSDHRVDNNSKYEMTGVRASREVGVLFWLINDIKSEQSVVPKISNIEIDKELMFSSIHVVDNARVAFIYSSISFVKNKFPNMEFFFHYAFSSSNYSDPAIDKFGKVMPVEYLTANILPFRLVNSETDKVTFCLSCFESFSEEVINRFMYLASDVSQDFTNDFVFLFPDYDHLSHHPLVMSAKRVQSKNNNKLNVEVFCYNDSFGGLING
jgi:hypothetical protein